MKWNDKLKEARIEKGISQQETANRIGISRGCYSNYELGSREPPFEIIVKICNVLGISADYLLGLEDEAGTKTYISNSFNNFSNSGNIKF